MGAEHVLQRESSTFGVVREAPADGSPRRDGLAADEKLPNGNYRRLEYITEAYHPHGIHVDATMRDRQLFGSNNEGELLFPGGMGSEYVRRVWVRETEFRPTSDGVEIIGQKLRDPQENPDFKYRAEIEEIEREMAV
jgi:hypothetical protein